MVGQPMQEVESEQTVHKVQYLDDVIGDGPYSVTIDGVDLVVEIAVHQLLGCGLSEEKLIQLTLFCCHLVHINLCSCVL